MSARPRDSLDRARAAYQEGDYETALTSFEHFFDNALDSEPSLYGVRLSYCLSEWARLGDVFPPARDRLLGKGKYSLVAFEESGEPELFHDYISICEYLGIPQLPIEQFLRFHNENRELAKSIVRFIWDQLVKERHWNVCIHYLEDPEMRYQYCLEKHDTLVRLLDEDPGMGGDGYEEQMKGWAVRDIGSILLVLKHNFKMEIFEKINAQAAIDFKERGSLDIYSKIEALVAH